MTAARDYNLQRLLEETDTLVRDIQSAGDLARLNREFAEATPDTDTDSQEKLAKLTQRETAAHDGYVQITPSSDGMQAFAAFYPPTKDREPVTLANVTAVLEKRGIHGGIDWTAIADALKACNEELQHLKNVVVARGTPPIEMIPEHLELVTAPEPESASGDSSSTKRVDHKKRKRVQVVREGQKLAAVIPRREGVDGHTIFGQVIPHGKRNVNQLKPGENVRIDDDYLVSTIDGHLDIRNHSLNVNPVLDLKSDVDYHTGNIEFPGDVILRKSVHDGFEISAGGSVYCYETLDASTVKCKGDLVAAKGIIGRNRGEVVVGGMVRARYIENCYVEARGAVYAESGIVNSVVYTARKLRTGRRGVVVGGQIVAAQGIDVQQLGTAMGPSTSVHCGIDYQVSNRLQWVQDKHIEVSERLERLKRRFGSSSDAAPEAAEARAKLEQARDQLQQMAEELVVRLDVDEQALIRIAGSLHPDAYLEIAKVGLDVRETLNGATFFLDKQSGTIKRRQGR